MKQGRTIFDLAEELERQRKNRKDFVADTRKLAVKTEEGQSLLQVVLPEGAEELANCWLFFLCLNFKMKG